MARVRLQGSMLPAALAVLAAFAHFACAAPAQAAEDNFYRGRTVRIFVGFAPGGGYDLYARTLGRYIGDHSPGEPTVLVQNMPGAGSLKTANYIYTVAPKDGTQFGTFSRGLVLDPLLGHAEGVQYDATRFTWIGSVSNEVAVCALWHTSGVETWEDMQTKEYKIGGSAPGADSDVFPTVLRNMFGLPLRLISGYSGAADINLGMQRGEVDGRCGWSWSSLVSQDKAMLDNGQLNIVLQLALEKHEDRPDVPLVMDLVDDPRRAAALRLIVSRQAIARPFAAPPGIPEDRARILRAAFDATMRDPEFLAEMERLLLEVRPVPGAELAAIVNEAYASPPDVVSLASEFTKYPE